ncbi:unnamed protein product, partial [Ectocarpus sp. 8 AP-2014]
AGFLPFTPRWREVNVYLVEARRKQNLRSTRTAHRDSSLLTGTNDSAYIYICIQGASPPPRRPLPTSRPTKICKPHKTGSRPTKKTTGPTRPWGRMKTHTTCGRIWCRCSCTG